MHTVAIDVAESRGHRLVTVAREAVGAGEANRMAIEQEHVSASCTDDVELVVAVHISKSHFIRLRGATWEDAAGVAADAVVE